MGSDDVSFAIGAPLTLSSYVRIRFARAGALAAGAARRAMASSLAAARTETPALKQLDSQ
jgi:hypothetical protein